MKIIVAGASGFLGTALRRQLAHDGHQVVQLVRSEPQAEDQLRWDPAVGRLDPASIDGADAVINLGGAPIARWPWTAAYKEKILQSRLETTGTVAEAIAASTGKPALVNASGINYYGDRGDERVDETATPGTGFLADVVQQWEAATRPARDAGARVVLLRTGVVLHKAGGALQKIQIPFRLGVGGRIGDGRQYFPTISLADYCAAVVRLATDRTLAGPSNLVAPVPATNAEFTHAMGQVLGRPTLVRVPRFVLTAAAGELSGEVLGSINAAPTRLTEAGYTFRHPTIADQVAAAYRP
ncbi:MAG: TIGR01777 family oxidoreductase [Nocardioidaceae bacterium]